MFSGKKSGLFEEEEMEIAVRCLKKKRGKYWIACRCSIGNKTAEIMIL
jgi:hypothetical protein